MTFAEFVDAMRPRFPRLRLENCRLTSPEDEEYNCIAWAADDNKRWWWPDPQEQAYWPPFVPRVVSLEAFESAFRTLGYADRTDATLEPGTQKVAIFVNTHGRPTHAARQLSDGWWASKLGPQIDIEHELSAIQGPEYGTVAVVLARPVLTS